MYNLVGHNYEIGCHDALGALDLATPGQSSLGYPGSAWGSDDRMRRRPSVPTQEDFWGKEVRTKPRINNLPFKVGVPAGFRLIGNAKWWTKGGNFYGSCTVKHVQTGAKLNVTASVPLGPVEDYVRQMMKDKVVEIGWNPWKSIKNAGKWVGNTVKRVASNSVVKKMTGILSNPAISSVMTGGFNLPMNIVAKATGVLNRAKAGSTIDKKKIANITDLASQGSNNAMALWNYMSQMYRNPQLAQNVQQQVQTWQQKMQQMQQQAQMKAMQAQQYQQQMMQRFRQPQQTQMPTGMANFMQMMAQQKAKPAPTMPMLPFNMPWPVQSMTPYGAKVSGWLYNIPYRSNVEAFDLDLTSPSALLRGAYHAGLTHFPEDA
jgi:hypothetical protein